MLAEPVGFGRGYVRGALRKSRSVLAPAAAMLVATAWLVPPAASFAQDPASVGPAWPEVTREVRPWTRWWWHGSAVTEEGLTKALESYRRAGLGGVEITPIYGVRGSEAQFIPYLSPAWVDRLSHSLREAERLDLGVDMATGTGWPFGGPWVSDAEAPKYVTHRRYSVRGGERLPEALVYEQEPILRMVGTQIYETYNIYRVPGQELEGTRERPAEIERPRPVEIGDLVEPITANPNLQELALDQVRFPKPLPGIGVMAYSASGEMIDLTDRVGEDGRLDWVAPRGEWSVYALFQGWHGKQVERAAPGGEGHVIDHFSEPAIRGYLANFDRAFADRDFGTLRGFFNDSYEVDDATGQADWTEGFFDAFQERRGYDLRHHLPALFGHDAEEKNVRVLTDYRETISDLILDTFTREWAGWAHGRGAIVRNQAHGSPGNILDLYAATDIPETEGYDLTRIKFASSAANVAGKRLVGAEAATWLGEHFTSTLAEVRRALDGYFVGGVNHIVYHGTAYSPPGAEWPGWLFYAAVHFTPANSWWTDFGALNRYVARVQSFLQQGSADNDVLLYFPAYDRYADRGAAMLQHFDGIPRGEASVFRTAAETMLARGYSFDYVSDRQLADASWRGGRIRTEGGEYRAIVLPQARFVPLSTMEKLIELARAGATVVLLGGMPDDVPGWHDLSSRQARFRALLQELQFEPTADPAVRAARVGSGRVLRANDLERLLSWEEMGGYHGRGNVGSDVRRPRGIGGPASWQLRGELQRRWVSAFAGTLGCDCAAPFFPTRFTKPASASAGIRRESMVDAGLEFARRRIGEETVYFIANWGEAEVDGWVHLAASGLSAAIYDPATDRTGFGEVQAEEDGLNVYLQLLPGESRIVRVLPEPANGRPWRYTRAGASPATTLDGPWRIAFEAGGPALPQPIEADRLRSWTELGGEELASFSGTGVYRISFRRPTAPGIVQGWALELGDVRESARVRLNGVEVGTVLGPSFRIELEGALLREENELEVHVSNLMANRIADLDRRGVFWKRFYNVNMPARLRENRNENGLFDASAWSPRPSGLIGPVRLVPLEPFTPTRQQN